MEGLHTQGRSSTGTGSESIANEKFDLIIIGAGIYGLYTAKTFLTICPTISLLVVDSLASIGGVWSKERVYPGLHLQHHSKFFEFSELRYEDVPEIEMDYNGRGYISGYSWYRYFQAWAEKIGVMKYIRLNTTVQQVTRQSGDEYLWKCQIGDDDKSLLSKKLIVATGISSFPRYPDLDYSKFSGPVMHHRYFGERYEELVSENVKEVVVYGASKSGLDAVMQLAELGKKVKWIIRKEGRGPPWLVDLKGSRSDLILMRIVNTIAPAAYQGDGFYGLHYVFKQTYLGKAFQKYAFEKFGQLVQKEYRLDDSQVDEILIPMVPKHSIIWNYNISGTDNYDASLYDRIRSKQTEVVRETITSLEGKNITLSSGESLTADAVVFATGFKTTIPFFAEDLSMRIGLPSTKYTEEYLEKWRYLEAEADERVYKANPVLQYAPQPPPYFLSDPAAGKLRLYHHILPTDPEFLDGSFVILGSFSAASTLQSAMILSLWAAVYMFGKMELPPQDEMEKTAAYEIRMHQIRSPGMVNDLPWVSFDFLAFSTMMLKELGLNPWRKKGWYDELVHAYTCHDYGDLAKEWVELHGTVGDPGGCSRSSVPTGSISSDF
ncbi:hypothetical protein AOL_s00006g378 [Orbilia oligospora ATCC 24927]|uniref:FAD/NAD(P)-binding domain-containing protein n=1 Tax=Arthrobotrys oligospora (strain ATCC 24927 / CBS 115.81 / DSM 1491) TaxID=756982 RepID=G1X0H7_ARTOA|nr:hypothetical protein AOL_s00006g378 [Orbilia oligospora ATCC 24927]EGX53512.1 hypothetical protein AOL_s00006g378 [Orbilia oligospora ATCC 24927]